MVCQFNLNKAELKSCSEDHHQLKLCSTQKGGYTKPFPLVLKTLFYVKEITGINEAKNSISMQLELWCNWNDPGVACSTDSAE